jgi:hypothetical protein
MESNEEKNIEKESKPNLVLGFDKLFEPTLKLLGKEIRDFIKGKLDNWKEKKKSENIQGHVQKALNSPGAKLITERREKNRVQLADAIKLEEWMKGAENVSPNEPILGKMWQEILKNVLKGDGPEEYLLKKMQILSPREAHLLLLLEKKGARGLRDYPGFHSLIDLMIPEKDILGKLNKDRLYLDMLKDKGLVEKKYLKDVLYPTVATIMTVMFIEFAFNIFNIKEQLSTMPGTELPILLIMYPLIFIFSFFFFGFGRYSLTEIGRELVRYAPDINIDELLENERKEANKANSADAKKPRG